MTEERIPIDNIYYLLCYAWEHINEQDVIARNELIGIEHIHDLLAKILARGTFKLVRKGIDRGYLEVAANLRGVRGKINISDTVKRALSVRSQVACKFEELSYNVLHNQILRSSLQSLLQLPDLDKSVKSDVRQAYSKLAGIAILDVKRQLFQRVQLDRTRRYYRFLLSICRLVYEQLLVNEVTGEASFAAFSDRKMWQLFEDFIIGFYKHEQDRFIVNGHGRTIAWEDTGTSDEYRYKLPRMEADVLLDSRSRRIVLDAKYYENAFSGRFNPKLQSAHLYQILAYMRNREATKPLDGAKHEGILLYPTVDRPISIEVKLEGYRIQAKSINLAQDWQGVHRDMLRLIES